MILLLFVVYETMANSATIASNCFYQHANSKRYAIRGKRNSPSNKSKQVTPQKTSVAKCHVVHTKGVGKRSHEYILKEEGFVET